MTRGLAPGKTMRDEIPGFFIYRVTKIREIVNSKKVEKLCSVIFKVSFNTKAIIPLSPIRGTVLSF